MPAERDDQRRLRHVSQIADRPHAEPGDSLRRRLADSPERADRQRMEELPLAAGGDEQQAVGLGRAARHLRERLGPRDADADRQVELGANPLPQPLGDPRGGAGYPFQAAHVEERLLHRQPLDHRRGVAEEVEELPAGDPVLGEVRVDDDRLGTQGPRPRAAHPGVDPARLRLVAGRHHHAAADDHRLAPAAADRAAARPTRRTNRRPRAGSRARRACERMFAYCGERRNPFFSPWRDDRLGSRSDRGGCRAQRLRGDEGRDRVRDLTRLVE